MDALMILLRVLHIGFGVFWAGTSIFMTFFLEPGLQVAGPAVQGPAMKALMPALLPFMTLSVITTVASGAAITLKMRWGYLDQFLASAWGWAILVGTVATMAAFVIGFRFLAVLPERMESVASSFAGRAPSAEQAQELTRLASRFRTLSRADAVLMLVAIVAMAVARYV